MANEMNMRRKFIAGNWKMSTTTTAATAERLAQAVVDGLGDEARVSIAICPPFPFLALAGQVLKGSPIALGAQNLDPEKEGAFTGEVSLNAEQFLAIVQAGSDQPQAKGRPA